MGPLGIVADILSIASFIITHGGPTPPLLLVLCCFAWILLLFGVSPSRQLKYGARRGRNGTKVWTIISLGITIPSCVAVGQVYRTGAVTLRTLGKVTAQGTYRSRNSCMAVPVALSSPHTDYLALHSDPESSLLEPLAKLYNQALGELPPDKNGDGCPDGLSEDEVSRVLANKLSWQIRISPYDRPGCYRKLLDLMHQTPHRNAHEFAAAVYASCQSNSIFLKYNACSDCAMNLQLVRPSPNETATTYRLRVDSLKLRRRMQIVGNSTVKVEWL